MKTAHFLRPVFTKLIIKRLQKGESLNLYGPPGIGKSRLLEDIEAAKLPDVRVVSLSFKGYQNSCETFCREVQRKAGLGGEPVKGLNAVIDKLRESGASVFLMIDHFNYFHNNPNLDAAYNETFIDALNAVRNSSRVSLLAVTEQPANSVVTYIDGKAVTSPLNLEPVEMTGWQFEEIRSEVKRRLDEKHLHETETTLLLSRLVDMKCGYGFLEHIAPKLICGENKELSIDERLNRWQKSFDRECRSSGTAKIVKTTAWMKAWLIVLNPFRQVLGEL